MFSVIAIEDINNLVYEFGRWSTTILIALLWAASTFVIRVAFDDGHNFWQTFAYERLIAATAILSESTELVPESHRTYLGLVRYSLIEDVDKQA